MNRTVTALLLVFLIQCGITAAVYWRTPGPVSPSMVQSLAPLDAGSIDEVRIGDNYDNETVLVKAGDRWLLPYLGGLPADPGKVDKLLDGITHPPEGWPVAKTTTARQRFQVADYYYQRRVTLLEAGVQLDTIYLGTSPGFRKVHARSQAADAIYSITFNAFDAPAISGAWLEPRLLQVRAPLRIAADSYSLHFDGTKWLSGTGRAPDERELEALISALRSLQVDGVAAQDLQRELSEAEADLVLRVDSLAGEVTLELFSVDDEYFIYSSEYPMFFKLSAYDYDRLTGIDFRLISGETGAPDTPGAHPANTSP